ncbi:flagellin [Devosia sp.]|uniref:flagellin N-terminal helical domain-containing protein n=1 Tax=Devosia sp. TaxID=1871048 RepID=UPI003A8E7E15
MADISLSKAVRSNLLNLQSTATQLGKTQERLATGLRVNSALDNPTNFFTASSLNSRASDLGQLLDSVGNAVQTIAAADKGITAITRLVESAQATARQALQTSATIDQAGGAVAEVLATKDSADTSAVTIAAATAATSASISSSSFSAVDLSTAAVTGVQSTITADSTFTDIDLSNNADNTFTFDITLGGTTSNISLSQADDTVGSDNTLTIDEAIAAIQSQLDSDGLGVTVGKDGAGTSLTFTAAAAGATALTVDNAATAGTGNLSAVTDLGITNAGTTGQTDTGVDEVIGDAITFDLTVGGTTQSITLDSSITAVDSTAVTADEIATAINTQFGSAVADGSSGELVITDATTGTSSVATIANFAATGSATTSGLADGTDSGDDATSSTVGDITINGQTVSLADGDDAAAILSKFQTAAAASSGTNAFTVSDAGGTLTFTGTAGNDLTIGGDAATLAAVGLSDETIDGTPAAATSTVQVTNPKRDELRNQYNDLLSQIDQLAKDSGFNGVNLLNGDGLSVLFNEDGSSKLDINGVTNDAAGLGLTELSAGDFDTNTSINSTLNTLKAGIDTLRTQSSKFGSQLSVVETRQDFTKNMINVLETGAANLTLADTNEEAANLLALQTRQQLSSTALSLASQSDQNVLRLF